MGVYKQIRMYHLPLSMGKLERKTRVIYVVFLLTVLVAVSENSYAMNQKWPQARMAAMASKISNPVNAIL